MFATAAGLLIAAMTAAGQPPAVVPPEAKATIAAANAAWLPAMQAGDASAIVEPYAADGVFVTANGDAVRGREQIAQLMKDRFARIGKLIGGDLVQDGLTRQGSFIFEWGHATMRIASREGGATTETRGRYLTVWQRNGTSGRWEIVRNLSLPD